MRQERPVRRVVATRSGAALAKTFGARATQYARDVVGGKIPAAKLLTLACQRHLSDLEKSKDKSYPYIFNPPGKKGKAAPAEAICRFAENMVHVKGEWAGKSITLEDWQCFLLGVGFGWIRRADGLRRFREFYWEIPRKNAKSTKGAIIGNYMVSADGEPGAEVMAGATSQDQAMFVFKPAWQMVKRNLEFAQRFGLELGGTENNPGNIYSLMTGSTFKVIIGKPGDGDNPHCALVDEYHEHATSEQYDAIKTGMGARRQPVRAIITTAGVDTSGPCYDKHLDGVKILEGTLENDELFVVIFGIDEEDDWKDFEVWRKANPNMGVSVKEDYLRSQLRDALQTSQQNAILTKNLNLWRNAGTAWMNMVAWEKCKNEALQLSQFFRKRCWLGADLASKIDIASLAYILEAPWGFAFFCKHYLPEERIELPENEHYRKWRDAGWITQTDGARTDLKRIEDDIRDASKEFSVQALAFDQKESNYLITNVQEWASFECIDVPQSPVHMSEPMKEMEAGIVEGEIQHNGDPVLTWMMGNVVKKQARGGGPVKSYYPTRQNEKNKIDGVVAGIMALSRAMLFKPATKMPYTGVRSF
jgi:phage terminase large subunit-like protein